MSLSPLALVGIIVVTAVVAAGLTAFWLRRRSDAGIRLHPREHPPEPEPPARDVQPTFVSPDFRPLKLAFGASEKAAPVMEISALRANGLPPGKYRLDPSSVPLRAFTPFLQLIPSTLTAAEFGRGNYMQILVHGPLALACEPPSFLPFVHGAQGQVEELARLRNSSQLRQLISSGMGWQLASALAAWKHLADISKRLDYIKKGVDEIKEFLTNERRSKIVGTLDYLRQALRTLGQKQSPETLRNQLEQIERELLQIQDHIMHDLAATTDKIGTIMQGRFDRRTKLAHMITAQADKMYELQKEWLLGMIARTVNWQVLSVFPGDKQLKISRKQSLYQSIDEFSGFLQQVHEQLHEKVAAVRSVLDSFSLAQQDKSLLLQFDLKRRLREDNHQISSDAAALRQEIRTFADRLWSPQKPLVLALKLDQGRIVEAYETGDLAVDSTLLLSK